jgi:ABC-type multidrug transport system ATPase subunit
VRGTGAFGEYGRGPAPFGMPRPASSAACSGWAAARATCYPSALVTTSPPCHLAASSLVVTFDGRAVVNQVDFSVSAGEIAVIEGPSGGGKSTLLRALASLQELTSGELTIDGAPARVDPSAFRVRVAYVPQLPAMFAGTVADNVSAGPGLRGIALAPARIDALLAEVGLDPRLASRPARELSGGEKQRTAIARALANEPSVLLFDEPTSALDPASAETITALIRTLAARGKAVVVVTHAREHAERLLLPGSELTLSRFICAGGKLQRQP